MCDNVSVFCSVYGDTVEKSVDDLDGRHFAVVIRLGGTKAFAVGEWN